MKKTTLLASLILVFAFGFHSVNSQNTKSITFQGVQVNMPNNIKSFDWKDIPQRSSTDQGSYLLIQFDKTPSQEIQNEFRSRGIALTDYVSNHSYFLFMDDEVDVSFLENSGVISIQPIPLEFKISAKIRNNEIGLWAVEGDNVLVNLLFHKGITVNKVITELNSIIGLSIREQYKTGNMITVSVPSHKMNQVANLSTVKWLELIQEPSVKEDLRGKSIHRSSNLDTQIIGGRNYTGEGIGVMVRDDGIVGPHIDFQGRIDNSFATGTGQTHGDGVAGIMAGAGNLDPTKRGMAAGTNLYVVNYGSTFLDNATTSLLNNGNVQITNSSYGNGCNAGYTTTTNTVDTQSNNRGELLHVFSAGNSGTSNCDYGAGAGWGNITGGHKQGKNVIATANVFFDGSMPSHSSNGPATDGRIKPDITAHGQNQLSTDENNGYLTFGGTSGAAPGIAGVSAQLYQLYMEENAGAFPESALIKAAMLNTANDYGNVGPDFKFGWGLVNGLRAAKLLEDERYLEDEITQGTENNHTINVPANTTQVRFMVYWNDPAAVAGASVALVNDLDLKVTDPGSTELLPWILDSTPNATNLDLPATNGVDRLNNMEQVLINNPQAGDYNININGFDVPSGPQHYFIVYEIITEELTLTYPTGNEKLATGDQIAIHWDAINTTDSFSLEYSVDNGSSWNSIGTAGATSTNYVWTVPSNISGECLVKITSGSFSDQSDDVFSIANVVSGIEITQVCPTDLTVTWDALTDATSYDVYMLGEKFMEKVGTTSSTSFSVPITDPTASFWVAVSATGGTTNWETRRSLAVNKSEGGLFNCSLNNDVTVESITNDFSALSLICSGSNSFNVSANIRNLGTDDQSNFTVSYQLDTNTIVQETYTGTLNADVQEVYTFSTPLALTQNGDYSLKVWVSLAGDEFVGNDETNVAFYAQVIPEGINQTETFDVSGFPPVGWIMTNSDNSTTWVSASNITGIDDQPTTTSYIDNYNYDANGQEDSFKTLIYDLSGSNLSLNFDLAKAQYSASYSDGLRVEISTDCGASFTSVYDKNGQDLSTLPSYNTTTSWTPSSGTDWRTEVIDLSGYAGQNVQIRFVNVNGYGNSTLIDNIRIEGTLSIKKNEFDANFSLYPNPIEDRFTIRSNRVNLGEITIYSLLGKKLKVVDVDDNQQIINVGIESLPTGIYVVQLKSELGVFFKKIIKS